MSKLDALSEVSLANMSPGEIRGTCWTLAAVTQWLYFWQDADPDMSLGEAAGHLETISRSFYRVRAGEGRMH
jgi:hypothetical protein